MSDTIWLMPLEPLDKRYTAQWYNWFPEVLESQKLSYEVIDGQKYESELEGKFFLDPISTNRYKLTQMNELLSRIDAGEVTDGDTVFFYDLWYPGIEILPYVEALAGLDLNIGGVFHAGTYDEWDLTAQVELDSFGEDLENAWLEFIDWICVGSSFHKDLLTEKRDVNPGKIRVTGMPVDAFGLYQNYDTSDSVDRIVFTGRQSEEKGWPLIRELMDEYPIESTLDRDLSKDEYYEFLANSKAVIAPSKQETFGYGVVEGMALDCDVIVPDNLAFTDTVPPKYRYRSSDEMRELIEKSLNDEFVQMPLYTHKYQYQYVISEMVAPHLTNE